MDEYYNKLAYWCRHLIGEVVEDENKVRYKIDSQRPRNKWRCCALDATNPHRIVHFHELLRYFANACKSAPSSSSDNSVPVPIRKFVFKILLHSDEVRNEMNEQKRLSLSLNAKLVRARASLKAEIETEKQQKDIPKALRTKTKISEKAVKVESLENEILNVSNAVAKSNEIFKAQCFANVTQLSTVASEVFDVQLKPSTIRRWRSKKDDTNFTRGRPPLLNKSSEDASRYEYAHECKRDSIARIENRIQSLENNKEQTYLKFKQTVNQKLEEDMQEYEKQIANAQQRIAAETAKLSRLQNTMQRIKRDAMAKILEFKIAKSSEISYFIEMKSTLSRTASLPMNSRHVLAAYNTATELALDASRDQFQMVIDSEDLERIPQPDFEQFEDIQLDRDVLVSHAREEGAERLAKRAKITRKHVQTGQDRNKPLAHRPGVYAAELGFECTSDLITNTCIQYAERKKQTAQDAANKRAQMMKDQEEARLTAPSRLFSALEPINKRLLEGKRPTWGKIQPVLVLCREMAILNQNKEFENWVRDTRNLDNAKLRIDAFLGRIEQIRALCRPQS